VIFVSQKRFICLIIILKFEIFQIICMMCYKYCTCWNICKMCCRFCCAYFCNKSWTWVFCNEDNENQDRDGNFYRKDQSEANDSSEGSFELRRLETNPVSCLICIMYKSKFLKFIFVQFVNYQEQTEANDSSDGSFQLRRLKKNPVSCLICYV